MRRLHQRPKVSSKEFAKRRRSFAQARRNRRRQVITIGGVFRGKREADHGDGDAVAAAGATILRGGAFKPALLLMISSLEG